MASVLKQEKLSSPAKAVKGEKKVLTTHEGINEVILVGRVSSAATEKELPSGDKVVEFRIVVDRRTVRGKKREVDTLDIASWSASARRSALSLKPDQWVEVSGAVRRRFWQAPSGLASRWQVEASSITKL